MAPGGLPDSTRLTARSRSERYRGGGSERSTSKFGGRPGGGEMTRSAARRGRGHAWVSVWPLAPMSDPSAARWRVDRKVRPALAQAGWADLPAVHQVLRFIMPDHRLTQRTLCEVLRPSRPAAAPAAANRRLIWWTARPMTGLGRRRRGVQSADRGGAAADQPPAVGPVAGRVHLFERRTVTTMSSSPDRSEPGKPDPHRSVATAAATAPSP